MELNTATANKYYISYNFVLFWLVYDNDCV